MPTTRKHKTRTRTGSYAQVPEDVFQGLKSGFGPLLPTGRAWLETHSDKEVLKAWKRYKKAILRTDLAQNREWGKPARRPWLYLEELEEKFPRLVLERIEFFRPWDANGPQTDAEVEEILESDAEYLRRLGKLEPWELEILENRNASKPKNEEQET